MKNAPVTRIIECTTELTLTYDPTSKSFQEVLSDFRESINPNATETAMLEHIASYILRFGSDRMIEGIGYLSVNGRIQGEPFSQIDLETDDFYFDFNERYK